MKEGSTGGSLVTRERGALMSEHQKFRSWQCAPFLRAPTVLLGIAVSLVLVLLVSGMILFFPAKPDAIAAELPASPGHVQVGESVEVVIERYAGGVLRVASVGEHTLLRLQNPHCGYYVLVGPQVVEAVLLAPYETGPGQELLAADYLAGCPYPFEPRGNNQWLAPVAGVLMVAREDGVVLVANAGGLQALETLLNNT